MHPTARAFFSRMIWCAPKSPWAPSAAPARMPAALPPRSRRHAGGAGARASVRHPTHTPPLHAAAQSQTKREKREGREGWRSGQDDAHRAHSHDHIAGVTVLRDRYIVSVRPALCHHHRAVRVGSSSRPAWHLTCALNCPSREFDSPRPRPRRARLLAATPVRCMPAASPNGTCSLLIHRSRRGARAPLRVETLTDMVGASRVGWGMGGGRRWRGSWTGLGHDARHG